MMMEDHCSWVCFCLLLLCLLGDSRRFRGRRRRCFDAGDVMVFLGCPHPAQVPTPPKSCAQATIPPKPPRQRRTNVPAEIRELLVDALESHCGREESVCLGDAWVFWRVGTESVEGRERRGRLLLKEPEGQRWWKATEG